MLNYALGFLVIAVIAGLLGFTGVAGTSAVIAKWIFILFLVLFAVSFVMGLFNKRGPRFPLT